MELSEATEILKECTNTIGVAYIPCRGKHKKIGLSTKDKIAINTVLQELENSISKDKIKEKIEELEVGSDKADGWRSEYLYAKEVLEELLKGE